MRFLTRAPEEERDPSTALALSAVPAGWSWLVFALALGLYLLTFSPQSDGLILGNDVVPYARGLLSEGVVWNPHHLLFHPLASLVELSTRPWGGTERTLLDSLRAHQIVSALGGAAATTLVFRFAASICGPLFGGWLALVFGLSTGTWLYASVGESYLPATAAVAGLLTSVARARIQGEPCRLPATIAWLVLAVLLRQDSVLVVPVLFLLLEPRRALATVGAAGIASLLAYAFSWWISGSEEGFTTWIVGPLHGAGFGGGIEIGDWVLSLGALGLALIFVPIKYAQFILATWLTALAAMIPFRPLAPTGRRILAAFILFVGIRTLFFTWWQPGNPEFHGGTILPLVLVAAILLDPQPRRMSLIVRALPQVALLTLIASGNGLLLIHTNRANDVQENSRAAIRWAGEQGLVLAIDRLQFYALLREEAEVEVLDASDIANGTSNELIPEFRDRIAAALSAGRNVVFVRDVVLAPRLGFQAWAIDGYPALIEGLDVLKVEDDSDRHFMDLVRSPR